MAAFPPFRMKDGRIIPGCGHVGWWDRSFFRDQGSFVSRAFPQRAKTMEKRDASPNTKLSGLGCLPPPVPPTSGRLSVLVVSYVDHPSIPIPPPLSLRTEGPENGAPGPAGGSGAYLWHTAVHLLQERRSDGNRTTPLFLEVEEEGGDRFMSVENPQKEIKKISQNTLEDFGSP